MIIIPIHIDSKKKDYEIIIGSHILQDIKSLFDFSQFSSVYIITDSNVKKLYLKTLQDTLLNFYNKPIYSYVFPAGETQKTFETVNKIYADMVLNKLDRKTLIINVGGGVVTDLGGFVASTYLRGISSLNISTTIEGMVDASVGGKVGIDFNGLKNIIGAYYQPNKVIIDVETIKTLPIKHVRAGFAEIIKHGLILDPIYFQQTTNKKPEEFSTQELVKIISKSCEIKAGIVEKDETEKNERKILNFGHTAGHAIESASLSSDQPLLHGEAVAIGMNVASIVSNKLKYVSKTDLQTIQTSLLNASLPITIPKQILIRTIMNLMKSDKKNQDGIIKWVLLKSIGIAKIDCEVPERIIIDSLRSCY